jgi:hypothetical protein
VVHPQTQQHGLSLPAAGSASERTDYIMTDHQSHSPLTARLARLRVALRGRLLLEGLAWALLAMAGLIVVTFAFDYTLRLDRPLRATILALCAVGVLGVLLRRLILPQASALRANDLAMLVERRYRQLGDRLISALQLADRREALAAGMSGAMIDRVISEAESQANEIKLNDIVDKRRLAKVWGAVLVLAVLLGGVAMARGDLAGLWYRRNILLQNIDWPQETYLRVFAIGPDGELVRLLDVDADGTITHQQEKVDVLRGRDLHIIIETTAASEAPDSVMLHAWYPSEGDTEEQLPRLGAEAAAEFRALREPPLAGERTYYHKTFLAVSEAFRFHITGGDDRRDARVPHEVRLLAPPALRDLRFTVAAPPYMRQANTTRFDGGRGVLSLHLGSTVTLQSRASKDIVRAEIHIDGEPRGEISISDDADGRPRRLRGQFQVTGENRSRTQKLRIVLEDVDGYGNDRGQQYLLQIVPDREPEASIAARGVRTVVAPTAYIPLVATAQDAIGLEGVQVRYRLSRAQAMGEGEEASVRAVTSPPEDLETAIVPTEGDPTQARGERVLDIRPLKLAVGSEVVVTAVATDLLPVEYGGPNVTTSRQVVFSVISRDELMGQLVAKQKEVRMEFFQAAGQHQLALGRAETLLEELKDAVPDDLARQAGDASARQQMVAVETLKAADTLEGVATELEFNRLGKTEDYEGIRSEIVLPLRQLLRMMKDVQSRLDAVAGLNEAASLQAGVSEIVDMQKRIAEEMEAILKRMRKLENRVELARRLESMLRMSVELKETISEEKKKGVVDIFDPLAPAEDKPQDETPNADETP